MTIARRLESIEASLSRGHSELMYFINEIQSEIEVTRETFESPPGLTEPTPQAINDSPSSHSAKEIRALILVNGHKLSLGKDFSSRQLADALADCVALRPGDKVENVKGTIFQRRVGNAIHAWRKGEKACDFNYRDCPFELTSSGGKYQIKEGWQWPTPA